MSCRNFFFLAAVALFAFGMFGCNEGETPVGPEPSQRTLAGAGAFSIVIDATALSAPSIQLSSGGQWQTDAPIVVNLDPGAHTLLYGTTLSEESGAAVFTVLADGTVDYDPSLDGILSGRGTSTLVANGTDITIDISALSATFVFQILNDHITMTDVATFTLLPGDHAFVYPAGSGSGVGAFAVLTDGTVAYDPQLEGILSGQGTTSLTANGAAISIDVSALSTSDITMTLGGPIFIEVDVETLNLLPGEHHLGYPASVGTRLQGVFGGEGSVNFDIGANGTLDFDPSLDGILSGRGTSTLTANGAPITLDVTALTAPEITIRAGNLGCCFVSGVTTLNLLPGEHHVAYEARINIGTPTDPTVGDLGIVEFAVRADATIEYDPVLEGILAGQGSSTLVAQGAAITVDISALSAFEVISRIGTDLVFGNGGIPTNGGVADLRLLPGEHEVYYVSNQGGFGGSPFADFIVERTGLIDYETREDLILSGRGTSNLIVNGAPIPIDATCIPFADVHLYGIGDLPSDVINIVTLLPGLPRFPASRHRIDVGVIGVDGFVFWMNADGVLDYDESLDDTFSGRGTSTLVIRSDAPECVNAPPVVGPITAPVDPVQVSTIVTASADFTDPNVLDTHTAEFDWGDGTTSSGTVVESDGSGSASGIHTYAVPGVYTITLTVTDDRGAEGMTGFQFVVVFDPDGGFVTGGGWIDSPLGAYVPDPALTGKANFGFVSKYKNGATVPTGSTHFKFTVADLSFKSTSYDWLVIAGARAQYKGSGTINGEGEFGFMLTAIDGQSNGGGGVDKFRIKIWDESTEAIVYDNQFGADDNGDPSTELGGGSIVIHKN